MCSAHVISPSETRNILAESSVTCPFSSTKCDRRLFCPSRDCLPPPPPPPMTADALGPPEEPFGVVTSLSDAWWRASRQPLLVLRKTFVTSWTWWFIGGKGRAFGFDVEFRLILIGSLEDSRLFCYVLSLIRFRSVTLAAAATATCTATVVLLLLQ